jgi:hypothetical protein
MCRSSRRSSRSIKTLGVLLCFVTGLLLVPCSSVWAQGCVTASGQAITDSPDPVKVGDTISYTVKVEVPAGSENCSAVGVTATLYLPNGTPIQYLTGASLTPGVPITCPGGPGCLAGPYTYVVSTNDFSDPLPVGSPCPPSPFPRPDNTQDTNIVVTAYHSALGTTVPTVPGQEPEVFFVCGTTSTKVLTPCLTVDKTCQNGVGEMGDILFSGVISNCSGNATLFNVAVSNLVEGASVLLTNVAVLSPRTAFTVSGVSMGAAGCEPVTDTLKVRGNDVLGGLWEAQDSATCSNVVSPCITVTKICDNVAAGLAIPFSGVVSNCGNVTLNNVIVVDNSGTPGNAGDDTIVFGPATLAPKAASPYSGSYLPVDCPSTNTVTASGTTAPACGGATVQDTDSAICGTIGTPGIQVSKTCLWNNSCTTPVVNYSITVTNTGELALNSVLAVDDNATPANPADDVVFNIGTLAVGAKAVVNGSYVPTTTVPTNTVIASGVSAGAPACGGGSNVTDTADCSVTIPCPPCIDITKACLATNINGWTIMFSGVVSNCGAVTLTDVTVTDDQAGAVTNVASLAPGAKFPYAGSYLVVSNNYTDVATVVGTKPAFIGGGTVSDNATATCRPPQDCITRTPGYWFNHLKSTDANCATLKKAIAANGGRLDLGFICLPTNGVANAETAMRQALSFFPPSKKGLSPLCAARLQLGFHLVAAIANTALMGTDPGACVGYTNGLPVTLPSDLIEQARRAAACDNIAAIQNLTTLLDVFNNSGHNVSFQAPLKPCGLGGAPNRDALRINVFTATNCGKTNNCIAGSACP